MGRNIWHKSIIRNLRTGNKNQIKICFLWLPIERLSRLAYPEYSHEVRDKIACAQFISALSDGFLRRTLQLESVSSLKSAVERAMAMKVIQENCFSKKYENRNASGFKKNYNFNNKECNNNKMERIIVIMIRKILVRTVDILIKIRIPKSTGINAKGLGAVVPWSTSDRNVLHFQRETRISHIY